MMIVRIRMLCIPKIGSGVDSCEPLDWLFPGVWIWALCVILQFRSDQLALEDNWRCSIKVCNTKIIWENEALWLHHIEKKN